MTFPSQANGEFFDSETHDDLIESYFNFGWCQTLSEIADNDVCTKDTFVGQVKANPTPSSESPC